MLPLHCPSLVFDPVLVPALCTLRPLLICLYVFLVLYPQIHSNGPGLGFDFQSCTLQLWLKAYPFSCHMRSSLVGTPYSTTAPPSESVRSVSCASLMPSAFVVSPHCCLAGGFGSQPPLVSLVRQGILGDVASLTDSADILSRLQTTRNWLSIHFSWDRLQNSGQRGQDLSSSLHSAV